MPSKTKDYQRDGRAPVPSKEVTSRVMSANKGKNTKPELTLRKALYKNNIKGYRINWKQAPGHPDIAFLRKKLAIFVHGCFWHRCPTCQLPLPKSNNSFWELKFKNNVERDQRKSEKLVEIGWRIVVIWECEIKKNINDLVDTIKNLLNH